MGIAGSIINPDFFEEYLGMRVESVDEVEIIRRMTEGIYDEAEFKKALKWTKENCKEGFDKNPDWFKKSDKEKEKQGIHSQRLGMNPFFYYGNSWVDETGWVSYNNSQKVKSIGRRGV